MSGYVPDIGGMYAKKNNKTTKKQKNQELKNVKFSFWLYMDLMYT